jgi:hypothetical protein
MMNVHENMQGLEGWVWRLEHVVDTIAHSASSTSERLPTGVSPTHESATSHSMRRFLAAADFLGTKIQKVNGERASFADSLPCNGRSIKSSWKRDDSISNAWDDFNVGAGHRTGLPGNAISQDARQVSLLASDFTGKVGCEDVKSEQLVNRRSWDRALGPMQLGEGPSARSVWQASNNEATTVAAIQGAPPPDNPISHQNEKTKEYKSDYRSTTGNKTRRGAFWMLWSHETECVRTGDLNRAYLEILGSGDELLLMWMMSCTGPVLHQLNPATVLQLIHSVICMLQQQGFLETVIPWIQQVHCLTMVNFLSIAQRRYEM